MAKEPVGAIGNRRCPRCGVTFTHKALRTPHRAGGGTWRTCLACGFTATSGRFKRPKQAQSIAY